MADPAPSSIQLADEVPASAEVVVIGGGIVGAASAFWLSRAGLSPLIVERGPALATATTAMSAHCIRAQFSEPENVAMMSESLAIFERFADVLELPADAGDIGLRQQGYLFASTKPEERDAFVARVNHQRQLGLDDVELIDGDDLRRRYPWLATEIAFGAFRRRDGWIDGVKAAHAFAIAARANVLLHTEVERLDRHDGRVIGIVTNRGRIATNMVVLAAGPFSAALAGENLPITPLRRHRVIVAPNDRIPQDGPLVIDANAGAHWRPHQGGALMAWAQPEPGGPPLWPVPADRGFPDLILRDPRGVGRLSPFWREVAPALPAGSIHLTAGQYTVTPDHKPLIGQASETAGLWLNTGYSGHGIMGSPSGGRLLADLMTGRAPADQNPFDPGRFAHGAKPPDVEQIVL